MYTPKHQTISACVCVCVAGGMFKLKRTRTKHLPSPFEAIIIYTLKVGRVSDAHTERK